MAAGKKGGLPVYLRNKISPLLVMAAGPGFRVVGDVTGVGLAAFALWGARGPVPAMHNALRYILLPVCSPAIVAAYYTLRPFKPYRANPFTRDGKKPVDERDPVVMRLVELYGSSEGRRALWRVAMRGAGVLYAFAGAFIAAYRNSLSWQPSFWLVAFPIAMGALFSLCWINVEWLGWGLRTWAERETSREGHG